MTEKEQEALCAKVRFLQGQLLAHEDEIMALRDRQADVDLLVDVLKRLSKPCDSRRPI